MHDDSSNEVAIEMWRTWPIERKLEPSLLLWNQKSACPIIVKIEKRREEKIDQDEMEMIEISTHRRWSILSLSSAKCFYIEIHTLLTFVHASSGCWLNRPNHLFAYHFVLRYHDEIALALQIITLISARNTICSCSSLPSTSHSICVDQIEKRSTTIRIKRART